MKIIATVASGLIAAASAQATDTAPNGWTDSQIQYKNLTVDSTNFGSFSWFTRVYKTQDTAEVFYTLTTLTNDNSAWNS